MRDILADLCHKQWSLWMKYIFAKCTFHKNNGTVIISAQQVRRWARQAMTSFSILSEIEKESDRKMADQFIEVFNKHNEELNDAVNTCNNIIDNMLAELISLSETWIPPDGYHKDRLEKFIQINLYETNKGFEGTCTQCKKTKDNIVTVKDPLSTECEKINLCSDCYFQRDTLSFEEPFSEE